MCFGDFEGMLLKEFDEEYKEYLRAWAAGETDRRFPGTRGESPDDVAARALDGLRAVGLLGGSQPNEGSHVCIVAHGRFNKILIAALQGDVSKTAAIEQGNTCINVIDLSPEGRAVLQAVNVRDHLPAGERLEAKV